MGIPLTDRQELLTQPLIAALSVAREDGRAPLTVPIWYDYTPGGDAWFVTGKDSLKTRLIHAAGRCTLMVERALDLGRPRRAVTTAHRATS